MEFADQICFTETTKSLKANHSKRGIAWHSCLLFLTEVTIEPNLGFGGGIVCLFLTWPDQVSMDLESTLLNLTQLLMVH